MSVVETEIGGIPVLFAQRDDGVCSAGLVFRVGGADEHLAVRGVTHLVEHLALRAAGLPPAHVRDGLSDLVTRFSVTGTPEQVTTPSTRSAPGCARLPGGTSTRSAPPCTPRTSPGTTLRPAAPP